MGETSHRGHREREFHDDWALRTPLAEIRVREAFEHPTALENRFILGLMGDLRGVRLLDVGAGLGEASVYFALQGARVTANDLSPAMLERCAALGRLHGVKVNTLLGEAHRFDFGEHCFDIVYGANVLHHLGDLKTFLRAVHRALAPGGRFYFYDPLAYNPIINIYRRLAAGVRTDDEEPLRFAHLALFREIFPEVQHREFWLSTLLLFVKFFLVDRVHPSADRYWKRMFREDPRRLGWWFRPLVKMDEVLLRLPLLPCLAWNMVVWGRREAAAGSPPHLSR